MNTVDGLLVDTNLLVLLAVGNVNRNRIETFKRTRRYTTQDYDLLIRVLGKFKRLLTVAHVLAEVSNLTDLSGEERLEARRVVKDTISNMYEVEMSSTKASEDSIYLKHGLTDAAIGAVAREQNCAVLTDDLALYLRLGGEGLPVINFSHLRALNW